MSAINIGKDLIDAVNDGRLEQVEELIDTYGLSHSSEWQDGYRLLCNALRNGQTKIAELLLKMKCKLNTEDTAYELTPLHYAVEIGNKRIVDMLLDEQADVQAANEYCGTPLAHAIATYEKDCDDPRTTRMEILELLVKRGANVDARERDGRKPLHVAVNTDAIKIVEFLLEKRSNPNAADDQGKTPLHHAILRFINSRSKIGLEIIELLVNRGADINVGDEDGTTPLHLTARHDPGNGKSYRVADYLLHRGAQINSVCTGCQKYTPLHFASGVRGTAEFIKLLLINGADVNAIAEDNSTPLLRAVEIVELKTIKVLVDHGANVDMEDSHGNTVLQLAVKNGTPDFVEQILRSRPDVNNEKNRVCLNTVIKKYCAHIGRVLDRDSLGFPDKYVPGEDTVKHDCKIIANSLVEYGFSVNTDDANDRRFMRSAVQMGNLKIVEDLLKCHPDANMLEVAVESNQMEMVELLLKYGADINHPDNTWASPIRRAIQNVNAKMTKLLVTSQAGVKVDASLFNNAVVTGNVEIFEILLEHVPDIDINAVDQNQTTALHCCAVDKCYIGRFGLAPPRGDIDINGQEEIATLLLNRGANVDARCCRGTTLNIAARSGRTTLVETLLKHNADVNSLCDYGNTPLYEAIWTNNLDVVKVLIKFGAHFDDVSRAIEDAAPRKTTGHLVKVKLRNFFKECEEERSRMRSEIIGNSNVSFCDVLTNDTRQLTMYARNESIAQSLESSDYHQKFPIYGEAIDVNLKKGRKRVFLLDSSSNAIRSVSGYGLPELVSDRMFDYLSNEDLENFVAACFDTHGENCNG